jgi:hypothetical protein
MDYFDLTDSHGPGHEHAEAAAKVRAAKMRAIWKLPKEFLLDIPSHLSKTDVHRY